MSPRRLPSRTRSPTGKGEAKSSCVNNIDEHASLTLEAPATSASEPASVVNDRTVDDHSVMTKQAQRKSVKVVVKVGGVCSDVTMASLDVR